MALLDVLTGMRNGPRGGGGGMSPITMAVLGLLAYKAVKGFTGAQGRDGAEAPGQPASGGLDDLLHRGFAGAGSNGIGAVLSNGLHDLVKQFQGAGKSDIADSWVATGENKPVDSVDIAKVLTPEQIEFLTRRTGLGREELLAGLAKQLPEAVDSLTPRGRLPGPEELDKV